MTKILQVVNLKLAVHQKSARVDVRLVRITTHSNRQLVQLTRQQNQLAEVLLQCANQSSSKDNELLEHLVKIGVEDDEGLFNAQTFLLENPTKIRVFYSFSVHHRKSVLMKMLQKAAK
ncbi:Uncharacterized protein Fot_07094 [Forsythia ovata]|uniref:Uncharacterized protein n=1 Tax=Forsythia ovata TaxID=205694 RepID=A0ABD1WYZ5_9LAMI